MRGSRRKRALSRGPFRSGSSFFYLPLRISRSPPSTSPSTSGLLISAGLRAESNGRVGERHRANAILAEPLRSDRPTTFVSDSGTWRKPQEDVTENPHSKTRRGLGECVRRKGHRPRHGPLRARPRYIRSHSATATLWG